MKQISVVGVNHKRTPVELREKLYFAADEIPRLLKELSSVDSVREVMVLSTCNRTEALLVAGDHDKARSETIERIAALKHLRCEGIKGHFYGFSGSAAVRHVFRVVAGLDSMVLGENEITGQFKNAYDLALKRKTAGKVLLTLYRAAMVAVKDIKGGTGISKGTVSVSHCAVKLAERALKGLGGKKVLVVGSGDMANSAAVAFMDEGVGSVNVVNRTHSRAVEMSRKYKGAHYEFAMLGRALADSDIILCSTSSSRPVLDTGIVEKALAARPERGLFIIDIAVPRDVEAGVKSLRNVHLYDIDDLKTMSDDAMKSRKGEIAAAERIVSERVKKFEKELYVREAAVLVGSIRDRIYRIAEEECAAAARKNGLDEREAENLRAVTIATVGRIIRAHMSELKKRRGEGEAESEGLLDAVRKAFGGL